MSARAMVVMVAVGLGSVAQAADIEVKNTNVPGRGFNDGTAATPVGLNFGTNRGDQALLVFQTAAAIWGATLNSPVPVVVDSAFIGAVDDAKFVCNATSVVLGYAAAASFQSDPGFPSPSLSYPAALANALAKKDLTAGEPHITARFNADLGTSKCAFPLAWYFGLDTNTPTKADNLLTVVLHELGHGLGFASLVSSSSGATYNGAFAPYDSKVYTTDGTAFTAGTNSDRVAQVTTPNGLMFSGAAVTADLPRFLTPTPQLQVSAADWPAAALSAAVGAFSAPVFTAQGTVVVASPLDGCSDLTNAAAIKGHVALIKRSEPTAANKCAFIDKAKRAEAAGAIMVVIYDTTDEALVSMSGSGTLSIPALFIGFNDGDRMASAAAREAVSLGFVPGTHPSNTDSKGTSPLLYTPATVQPGSTLSHWNTGSYPATLLMEPASEPDMRLNLDLTPAALSDMGWSVATGMTVSVVKALSPYVALNGANKYIVAVINRRATSVASATLSLGLPSGSTVTGSQGACTAMPCTLTSLASGELRLMVVTVQSSADAVSPYVVSATLAPSSADANDRLTTSTSSIVASGGDLSVTVTGPASLGSNQTDGFKVTVTNNGPGVATDVSVTGAVTASDGTTIVLVNRNDCTNDYPCKLGDLLSGASREVTSSFTTPDHFKAGLTFKATITASSPDSNAANDTFTFTVAKPACGCTVDGPASVLGWAVLALGLLAWRRPKRA